MIMTGERTLSPLLVPHPGYAFGGCFIPTPERLANGNDVQLINRMIRRPTAYRQSFRVAITGQRQRNGRTPVRRIL